MPNSELNARLGRLYRALQDRPLTPDDPSYLPFLQESGVEDPMAELATRIEWTESASVHLLTGQRGSGKSTELRRLCSTLEAAGCRVFLCDMREYMNLTTPVEISDFLFSVVGALGEATRTRYGEDPGHRGYLERVTDWLKSEVAFNELEAGVSGVSITASIKDDPSFKQRLQQHLRGHVARIIRDAHAFVEELVAFVRARECSPDLKVVLLVDSVEQLRGVGVQGAQSVYSSAENLFSGHAPALMLPTLHVVYTIPPYLTPLAPGLGRQLGGGMVQNLPSVHVARQDGDDDEVGLSIMRRILDRRSETWREVFSEQQADRLASASGGDLRDFFRLVRETLVKARGPNAGELPVTDALLEQSEEHLRREMLPIAADDLEWLRRIHHSKQAELESIGKLPQLARFFDTNLVLSYRNGDDWYDVHPLLRGELDAGE